MATRRLVALDALRAIAVFLVLGRHILDTNTGFPDPLQYVLGTWGEFGWIGVDLFFVLSGFLVSGLLFHEYQKHGTIEPLRFLGRRGLKIYPGFYALFVFTLLYRRGSVPLGHYVSEALFVQNYFSHLWNHTWSLAVEEHFYLGLAVLLWRGSLLRGGKTAFVWFPWFAVAVCAMTLGLRTIIYLHSPHGYLLFPTHYRLDALLFGALLSYLWSFHRPRVTELVRRFAWPVAIASAVLVTPCILLPVKDNTIVNTIGLTANYLGFGGVVILAVVYSETESAFTPVLQPLARIGFYSYSIYLWHMPINHLCRIYLKPRVGNPLNVAAYLVLSIVIGILAAKLIEIPVLKLRDRWLPSRVATAT